MAFVACAEFRMSICADPCEPHLFGCGLHGEITLRGLYHDRLSLSAWVGDRFA